MPIDIEYPFPRPKILQLHPHSRTNTPWISKHKHPHPPQPSHLQSHSTPLATSRPFLLPPPKLEPSRHQSLEHAAAIIPPADPPQELDVLRAVARNRVLRLQRVVQVQVLVVQVLGAGVGDGLAEEGFGGGGDGGVVGCGAPLDGEVEPWQRVLASVIAGKGDVGGDVQTRSWLPSRPSTFPPLAAPRLVMERGMG